MTSSQTSLIMARKKIKMAYLLRFFCNFDFVDTKPSSSIMVGGYCQMCSCLNLSETCHTHISDIVHFLLLKFYVHRYQTSLTAIDVFII